MRSMFASAESFWMPPQSSSVAGDVDGLFLYILAISAFFFILIAALLVLFVVRYRWQKQPEPGEGRSHNTWLEVTWTVIPLLIVGSIFYYGFVGYLDMRVAHGTELDVRVNAWKWDWEFEYGNGYTDENLHVPRGRKVKLVLYSQDVIHSFFVPAFRVKQDLTPGRYTTVWFEALDTGEFPLYCAEYCGTKHSQMTARVIVHEPAEYEAWLAEATAAALDLSPVELGERLYRVKGCQQCHSIDGKRGIGPSFLEAWGTQRALASGESAVFDENYLRESILEPQARVVAGYQPVMPTYQGKLSDADIDALIAYIESLGN